MINRAIVIFPNFDNVELIEGIRKKYDPLCDYIAPHLTLIFPFQSDLTTRELINHLENQLKGLSPFELVLKGVTGASDGYVFLDVKIGNDKVIELHDKLYKGILEPYHNRYIPYIPHITIAKLNDSKEQGLVVDELLDFDVEFCTIIDKLTIEIIDDAEHSILEYEYKL